MSILAISSWPFGSGKHSKYLANIPASLHAIWLREKNIRHHADPYKMALTIHITRNSHHGPHKPDILVSRLVIGVTRGLHWFAPSSSRIEDNARGPEPPVICRHSQSEVDGSGVYSTDIVWAYRLRQDCNTVRERRPYCEVHLLSIAVLRIHVFG